MIKHLRALVRLLVPPSIPVYTEEQKRNRIRDAVASTATGNVLLQFGRYLTKADIDILKEEALSRKS